MKKQLSHLSVDGEARMVNIGLKSPSRRRAVASGFIRMGPETLQAVRESLLKKGDAIGVARVASVMGAKKTADLIPLCHPLAITGHSADFKITEKGIYVEVSVETLGQTGVEMEALVAVSTALLTLYDMTKALDKGMVIENIQLERKSGGKSGDFRRSLTPGKKSPR